MDNEIWKKIPNHPEYEASSLGRVRSLNRIIKRKNRWGVDTEFTLVGRILRLKNSLNNSGYASIKMGAGKSKMLHRIICSAFHGEPKKGQVCNHKNRIRTDNRAENLEWMTYSENTVYSRRFFNTTGKSKNYEWAKSIIKEIGNGARVVACAKKHAVSRHTVSRILNGRMYPDNNYPEIAELRKKHPYKQRRGPIPALF